MKIAIAIAAFIATTAQAQQVCKHVEFAELQAMTQAQLNGQYCMMKFSADALLERQPNATVQSIDWQLAEQSRCANERTRARRVLEQRQLAIPTCEEPKR
jgi:hypothetical protein